MPEWAVRAALADDRPYLLAAITSDQSFGDEEITVAVELIDDYLRNGERDYVVRVVDTADIRCAGYVCFGQTPMTQSTFDLYWVVTHARARGLGVASGLIRAMEEELRKRGPCGVRIETGEKEVHGAARRLYERCGYREAGRLADFYSPGDGLLIYYKQLNGIAGM